MPHSRFFRIATLSVSNILIPIALLTFASGFFPYKPFLPGLATFEDGGEQGLQETEALFDRVVFMVVDALRSDFVYGFESGFDFTQSLIRSGAAIPFTAHATPPTVTMPRVKALTTGSVPSFLDLILNFAESDTTSSLATQDTWLAQIKAKGGRLVFYGDDTWLKLFPGDFFARADGTSSFFVSDFTEVDQNVTRHVPDELARADWNALIMHYLGLDHIGHKTGPQGPNMLPKQREMDGIVRQVYQAMETYPHLAKTLLVLAGDHGMNAGGNHGGSGPGETEPALLFASPILKAIPGRAAFECPTTPKEGTEFHYYSKIEQSDVVPVLAGLMNMPISRNSLGVFPIDLVDVWPDSQNLRHLHRNAEQILNIVKAKYGAEAFDQKALAYKAARAHDAHLQSQPSSEEEELALEWAGILQNLDERIALRDPSKAQRDYYKFLKHAQEAMSDTASSYHLPRMIAGLAIATVALTTAIIALPSTWPPSAAGIFFAMVVLLYGVMMFASSYVEEEQHFWYWLAPVWTLVLTVKSLSNSTGRYSRTSAATACLLLLATHRIAVRWNQTGQKHAGEPDIVHSIFPEHHAFMWVLILATYGSNFYFLHNKTFAGILMSELTVFVEVSLTFLAIAFKLNFTQADAPELVQGLGMLIRTYSAPFSLVEQARAVFGAIAAALIAVIVLSIRQAKKKVVTENDDPPIALSERVHHLLALFLMTQTRAPNIPLFLFLEIQRLCVSQLTSRAIPVSNLLYPSITELATTGLIFSNVYYFCMGGSNSISSIDLSNAYNGVADYNIAAVGILLFASNWAAPTWWCSAISLLLLPRREEPIVEEKKPESDEKDWIVIERSKLHKDAVDSLKAKLDIPSKDDSISEDAWSLYVTQMTCFIAGSLLAVMAACTALRTHLFIWTVFSPKYLYAMAWCVGWHLMVNVVFGNVIYRLRLIV